MMLLLFFLVDEIVLLRMWEAACWRLPEPGATNFHSLKAGIRCPSTGIEMRHHPEPRQQIAMARGEAGPGFRRDVQHV